MAAVAVTGRRVRLVEGLRTGVSPGGGAARDHAYIRRALVTGLAGGDRGRDPGMAGHRERGRREARCAELEAARIDVARRMTARAVAVEDRKSTRLNSSHVAISYAVFCLKK